MPTIKDPDSGKRKHVCDGACRRRCDHCGGIFSVHWCWRWGVESFKEHQGGGGLMCIDCGHKVFELLHEGIWSKEEFDADE